MFDSEKDIWRALEEIMDPEIPVVSLVEMGIIRSVVTQDESATVTITPTFSGCPALEVMRTQIREKLEALGYPQTEVVITLSPPWSTDWITKPALQKLKNFGIAPPARHAGNVSLVLMDPVPCPYCDSTRTSLQNSFGSTPCRMIFTCQGCRQPFEYFKPL